MLNIIKNLFTREVSGAVTDSNILTICEVVRNVLLIDNKKLAHTYKGVTGSKYDVRGNTWYLFTNRGVNYLLIDETLYSEKSKMLADVLEQNLVTLNIKGLKHTLDENNVYMEMLCRSKVGKVHCPRWQHTDLKKHYQELLAEVKVGRCLEEMNSLFFSLLDFNFTGVSCKVYDDIILIDFDCNRRLKHLSLVLSVDSIEPLISDLDEKQIATLEKLRAALL